MEKNFRCIFISLIIPPNIIKQKPTLGICQKLPHFFTGKNVFRENTFKIVHKSTMNDLKNSDTHPESVFDKKE